MVLAVIAGASLSRSLYTWNEMGRSFHRDSALHVAESGVEMTIYALNHQRSSGESLPGDFGQLIYSLSGLGSVTNLNGVFTDANGQSVGSYATTVEFDPTNPARAFITSVGTVPPGEVFSKSRVNRTVRVVVHRKEYEADAFGAAVYTPTWIDTNGITEIHGNIVSGDSVRTVGSGDPHDRVTQYTYDYWDEDAGEVKTAYGECDEGRNLDADPDNDVVLPFDEFVLERFKEIAMEQGYYFNYEPRQSELPTSFYQPDGVTPNIVFITSSVHITGNYVIGGVIFVVGDIIGEVENAEFGGNDQIEGIIYTTGLFRTHGGGNRSINVNGGVFCGVANLQGHATVEYNWEYFDALKNMALASNKFRFVSWQEIIGDETS